MSLRPQYIYITMDRTNVYAVSVVAMVLPKALTSSLMGILLGHASTCLASHYTISPGTPPYTCVVLGG